MSLVLHKFLFAQGIKHADLENNTLKGTRGIELFTFADSGIATILRNRAYNLDGRPSGGVPCANEENDFLSCGATFVQIMHAKNVAGSEIAWNEVINTPEQSTVEDIINILNARGAPDHPIRIHDNYIQGAYPPHPASDSSYSGSGINVADGDTQAREDEVPAYIEATNNQVVSTANVGMLIAAGHDNLIAHNRIISSGLLPDGRHFKNYHTGLYIWDCCYGQTKKWPPVMYNNVARDNVIGYAHVDEDGQNHRIDTVLTDCAKNSDGSSQCTNNVSVTGSITREMEQHEYLLWQQKVTAAGIPLGA